MLALNLLYGGFKLTKDMKKDVWLEQKREERERPVAALSLSLSLEKASERQADCMTELV